MSVKIPRVPKRAAQDVCEKGRYLVAFYENELESKDRAENEGLVLATTTFDRYQAGKDKGYKVNPLRIPNGKGFIRNLFLLAVQNRYYTNGIVFAPTSAIVDDLTKKLESVVKDNGLTLNRDMDNNAQRVNADMYDDISAAADSRKAESKKRGDTHKFFPFTGKDDDNSLKGVSIFDVFVAWAGKGAKPSGRKAPKSKKKSETEDPAVNTLLKMLDTDRTGINITNLRLSENGKLEGASRVQFGKEGKLMSAVTADGHKVYIHKRHLAQRFHVGSGESRVTSKTTTIYGIDSDEFKGLYQTLFGNIQDASLAGNYTNAATTLYGKVKIYAKGKSPSDFEEIIDQRSARSSDRSSGRGKTTGKGKRR